MLRKVVIDTKPDGYPITMPASINEANFDQQVKLFIEIADYNPMDGELHISRFRSFHRGEWTRRILEAIVQELNHPSLALDITHDRKALVPFFEYQRDRHQNMSDADFSPVSPPRKPM